MDLFGLGLILNFTDNASAQMRGAIDTFNLVSQTASGMSVSVRGSLEVFQSMSIIGTSLQQLGSQAYQAGNAIAGVFKKAVMGVVNVGQQMFSARTQLNKLFSDSAGGGEEMLGWIKQYSQTSVFEFQDVLKSAIAMKTAMIDVRTEITTSSGKGTQNILDYASDLASFNPQAKNAYGTGVQAAMGAFKEYIAESNAMSLKRGFSLDITQILGEEKGATAEARTQQVADLIEKAGMLGMTKGMQGTAANQLSNMKDLFFNMMADISDKGVYDKYTEVISRISASLMMTDKEKDKITNAFADALMTLIKPIDLIVSGLIKIIGFIKKLALEHPGVFKLAVILGTVASATLILGGAFLAINGIILKLVSGIGGLVVTSAPITAMLGAMSTAFISLVASMLPIIALTIAMKYIWDNNLFGMRDTLTKAFGDIYNTVRITFDFLKDGTASLEDFDLAQKMGIVPFITAMMNLKYNVGHALLGIRIGFIQTMEQVKNFTKSFEPITVPVVRIARKIAEVMGKIVGPKFGKDWLKAGESIGKFIAIIATALPIITLVIKAISVLTSPIGLVITALFLLKKAWDMNLGGIQEKTAEAFEYIKGKIDFKAIWDTLVTGAKKAWEVLKQVFGIAKTTIMPVVKDLGDMIISVLGDVVPIIVDCIGPAFEILWEIVKDVFSMIGNACTQVLFPAISVIATIVKDAFAGIKAMWDSRGKSILDGIKTALVGIGDYVKNVWNNYIMPILSHAISVIKKLWSSHLKPLWDNICQAVGAVIELLLALWNNVIAPQFDWFAQNILPGLKDFFKWLLDAIGAVVGWLADSLSYAISMFKNLCDFLTGIFSGDWGKAWDAIKSIFKDTWIFIGNILVTVLNAIIKVINKCIEGVYNLVTDFINTILGGISTLAEQFGLSFNVQIGGKPPQIPTLEPPKLNTGGEIKKEGQAIVHPAEVVVNSDLTRKLSSFLNSPHQQSTGGEGISVNFGANSIQINTQSTDRKSLEKMASELEAIIKRNIEKERLVKRKPLRKGAFS